MKFLNTRPLNPFSKMSFGVFFKKKNLLTGAGQDKQDLLKELPNQQTFGGAMKTNRKILNTHKSVHSWVLKK